MYNIFLTPIIFLISVYTLMAQAYDLDVVYINDSISHRGTVIEQKPGEYIRLLETASSDTLTFSMDEIDRLVRIPANSRLPEDGRAQLTESSIPKHRISPVIYGATGGGDIPFGGGGIGFDYKIKKRIKLGLGVFYFGETSRNRVATPIQWQRIPITVQFKYDLQQHFNNRGAFYMRTGLGYSVTLNPDYTDSDTAEPRTVTNGVYFNPAIGYRLNIYKNMGITLDVGYLLITDTRIDERKEPLQNKSWDQAAVTATVYF